MKFLNIFLLTSFAALTAAAPVSETSCFKLGKGCGISSDCCGDLTCGYFAVDGVLDWTQKVCGPK